jgi:hypothetical protein
LLHLLEKRWQTGYSMHVSLLSMQRFGAPEHP